ncbi:hypothetical protein [Prevotella histicola]|uniref:hypothetical protein n=1 Tax=Prevotella histicola TaxID=470565 RepID=UPI0028E4FB43|nr:hypothetical protein [Prevotella histicola]
MKQKIVFTCMTILLFGCKESVRNDLDLYGNTFINIDSKEFKVPSDWIRYNLMDSACSIMMPPNMKETVWDGFHFIDKSEGTTFSFNDTTDSLEHFYSRVAIDYFRANQGTFAKRNEYLVLDKEAYTALDNMVDAELESPDLILNGPFYDCSETNQMPSTDNGFTSTYYLDTYYRRRGLTGNGPVSVHIFIMQNDDKMVKMMISYHDKDSLTFNNLFQSIKTFKWNE